MLMLLIFTLEYIVCQYKKNQYKVNFSIYYKYFIFIHMLDNSKHFKSSLSLHLGSQRVIIGVAQNICQ